jgi:hypothetical protein
MFEQLLPNKNKMLQYTIVQHSDSAGADSGKLRLCSVSSEFQKIYKIFRYIESDACMEH